VIFFEDIFFLLVSFIKQRPSQVTEEMAYTNSYGIRGCFDGLHTPDCGSPQIDRAREEEHRLKMDALRAREVRQILVRN
jgi:hypothetical protein